MKEPVRLARLGDVCEINPRLPRPHGLDDDTEVGFVPMAAVDEVSGAIRACRPRPFAEVRKGYTPFAENDVLFAKISPCMENGKVAIARDLPGGRGFGSTEFHVLRAGPQVLPEWIYYFLRRRRFRTQMRRLMTGTAGQQRVPVADMAAALIPVPDLADQQRMVERLSCADSAIRLRRRSRAVLDQCSPALMLQTFGDPASNPKGWPVFTLGELLEGIDSGKSPRCLDRPKNEDEWAVLRLSALRNGLYNESDHKTLPPGEAPDTRSEVCTGDLLFVRKNAPEFVGTPAYVWNTRGRILMPDLIFRLRPRPDAGLNPLYLWALLRTPAVRQRLRVLASGTAASMPNISKDRLRTLKVMLPPTELQEAFARRMAGLHTTSEQHDTALDLSKSTFEATEAKVFDIHFAGGGGLPAHLGEPQIA